MQTRDVQILREYPDFQHIPPNWRLYTPSRVPLRAHQILVAIGIAVAIQVLFFWALGAIKPPLSQDGLGTGAYDAVSLTLGPLPQNAAIPSKPVEPPDKPSHPPVEAPETQTAMSAPAPDPAMAQQEAVAAPMGGGGSSTVDDPYARASIPGGATGAQDKVKLAGNIVAQVKICWIKGEAEGAVKLSMTLNDHGALMGEPVAAGPASPTALAAAVDAAKACAPYALGPAPGLMQSFNVELGGR